MTGMRIGEVHNDSAMFTWLGDGDGSKGSRMFARMSHQKKSRTRKHFAISQRPGRQCPVSGEICRDYNNCDRRDYCWLK